MLIVARTGVAAIASLFCLGLGVLELNGQVLLNSERRRVSCRWIIPFSKQFAFIALSHAPLPRAWRCWLLDAWLRHLYWFCMIERMAPAPGSARSFSGQCSDAFFKLTHRNQVKYLVDEVAEIDQRRVKLCSGRTISADVLVVACAPLY